MMPKKKELQLSQEMIESMQPNRKVFSEISKTTVIEKMVAKLHAKGVGEMAVAGSLGISLDNVRKTLSKPHVKALIEAFREDSKYDLNKDVHEQISSLIQQSNIAALTTILDILNLQSEDPRTLEVKRKTAFGLLDRGGHAPVIKSETKNLSVVLTPERIKQINSEANAIEAEIVGVKMIDAPVDMFEENPDDE